MGVRNARADGRRRWSWRGVGFVTVLLAYLVVTLGVAYRSPILHLDADLFALRLRHNHPGWHYAVKAVVIFGQRGPATLFFLPVFVWTAWRRRSTRPFVLLGTGLILLNLSVGIVKVVIGRLGPLRTADTHAVFVGGNIYPSGHVSNTVVLYGLIALIAVRHRRAVAAAAVALSFAVGLGTIYLDTHWFSDVVGGWLAGALVLLVLPTVMPAAQRMTDAAVAAVRRRFARRPALVRIPAPVPVAAAVAASRATTGAGSAVSTSAAPGTGAGRLRPAAAPPTGRRHGSVVRIAPVAGHAAVPHRHRLATTAAARHSASED